MFFTSEIRAIMLRVLSELFFPLGTWTIVFLLLCDCSWRCSMSGYLTNVSIWKVEHDLGHDLSYTGPKERLVHVYFPSFQPVLLLTAYVYDYNLLPMDPHYLVCLTASIYKRVCHALIVCPGRSALSLQECVFSYASLTSLKDTDHLRGLGTGSSEATVSDTRLVLSESHCAADCFYELWWNDND